MHGVLDMADKTAIDAMIPIDRVFMLDIERRLDRELIKARTSFA
jgi:CBS domain containing-hemolysin-like protein